MRNILIICSLIILGGVVWLILSLRTPNHFGGPFTGSPKAEVADLLARPTEYLGKRLTIEGKVADQCPSTGCFFYFKSGNSQLKVELGDLAQQLPKRQGSIALVEGQLMPLGQSYQFLGTAVEFR